MNNPGRIITLFLALILITSIADATDVRVIGLFTNKALLKINGQQKLLTKGESFDGVTLESASGRGAVVLIDGESRKLGLNQTIQGNYKKPERIVSKIFPDFQGMYFITGKVNGQPMRFLVDTGATNVTLSGQNATRIGIDFKKGVRGYAKTAASTVPVWRIMLDSVRIGDINVPNVQATVIEGSEPSDALLGNSFLKHTRIQRIGRAMEIEKRY
jgi:aspartyl protease family protein